MTTNLNVRDTKTPFQMMMIIFKSSWRCISCEVPMHHDFKPSFRAMREAIFVLNPEDVAAVKAALHGKIYCATDKLPNSSPDISYERLKAVFHFFKDKKDAK